MPELKNRVYSFAYADEVDKKEKKGEGESAVQAAFEAVYVQRVAEEKEGHKNAAKLIPVYSADVVADKPGESE